VHTPSSFRLTGLLSLCFLIFTGIASSAHADFTATLQSVRSGKCVDVSGSSQANRATIIQYSCHAGDNQRIRFEQFPDTDDYLLRFQHSEKCLEIPINNTQNGTDVYQTDCHANKNQRWRIEELGNNQIRIVQVQSGKVLDVEG